VRNARVIAPTDCVTVALIHAHITDAVGRCEEDIREHHARVSKCHMSLSGDSCMTIPCRPPNTMNPLWARTLHAHVAGVMGGLGGWVSG
jgi:hypothetical protein